MSDQGAAAAQPSGCTQFDKGDDETVSRLREEHFRRKLRKVLRLRRGLSDAAMLAEAHRRLKQALATSALPGRQIAPQVLAVLRRYEGATLTLRQAVLLSSELDALTAPKSAPSEPRNQIAAGLRALDASVPTALPAPLQAVREQAVRDGKTHGGSSRRTSDAIDA